MLAPQSLKTLSLTYASYQTDEILAGQLVSDDLDRQTRISLAHFPNLRHLTLGMAFIFGARIAFGWRYHPIQQPGVEDNDKLLLRCLPLNTETLHLIRCEKEETVPLFANVEALLWEKREGLFDKLTSISVKNRALFGGEFGGVLGTSESEDIIFELLGLAASVGFDFRIL